MAPVIASLAGLWLLAGIVAAVIFLRSGLALVEGTEGTSRRFKSVIFPGLVLLWPLVLARWQQVRQPDAGDGQAVEAFRPAGPAVHLAAWAFVTILVAALAGIAFLA